MSKTLVSKLIERPLVTIRESETVAAAIKKLVKHKIGAIPVTNETAELTGILSERDIVKALAKVPYYNLSENPISKLMTSTVIFCDRKVFSDKLMELMTKNKIRHIPIVEHKKPIGIVSIGDVVNRLLEKSKFENQMLKDYLSG